MRVGSESGDQKFLEVLTKSKRGEKGWCRLMLAGSVYPRYVGGLSNRKFMVVEADLDVDVMWMWTCE